MKTLIKFAITLLMLVFCATAASALSISVYHYQNNGWARYDGHWSKGNIALLVHGFPMFEEGKNRNSLIPLAIHLSKPRRRGGKIIPGYDAIYAVEYPKGFHIIETAVVLDDIINNRCRDLPKATKIDVFSHSMGGLVSRCASEVKLIGKQPISDRVAHLVMMGTPNNGFPMAEIEIFKKTFGNLPEVSDMDCGEMFIRGLLNFTSDKKPRVDCDYYSIVGRRSYRPKPFLGEKSGMLAKSLKKLMDKLVDVHDGLVDANSAGYDLSGFCQIFKRADLDLNHDYIMAHQEVFATIDNWMIEDNWFGELPDQPIIPVITNFTGGLPILLGKTQAEVTRAMKRSLSEIFDWNYKDNKYLCWRYLNFLDVKPDKSKVRNMEILFGPDRTRVKNVLIECDPFILIHPQEIVPQEILNRTPDIFCRSRSNFNRDYVTVIWYINGSTFCLDVGDSKRKLYDSGPFLTHCRLNENGRDFIHGDKVWRFAYMDRIIDPYLFYSDPNDELFPVWIGYYEKFEQ